MLRNEALANIFYRLKLIEAYGTGMLKIENAYRGCNRKTVFEATANAFRVTLPNMNYDAPAGTDNIYYLKEEQQWLTGQWHISTLLKEKWTR